MSKYYCRFCATISPEDDWDEATCRHFGGKPAKLNISFCEMYLYICPNCGMKMSGKAATKC